MSKTIFYISMVVMVAAIAVIFSFGLKLNADFTGGSVLELGFSGEMPATEVLQEGLAGFELGEVSVIRAGENGVQLKMKEITEETHQQIVRHLRGELGLEFEELQFDSVGPTLGAELRKKSTTAIVVALIIISIYLTIIFRKLRTVLNPFVFGLGALVALLHDIAIPVGVFALLGYYRGIEIDPPMIAAALTILGYSVNDTVVVFDRIRENYIRHRESFSEIIKKSIKQITSRSINTSVTTLLAVGAIYVFGGETLKNFSLALLIGISLGAYSSLFVAPQVLLLFHKRRR